MANKMSAEEYRELGRRYYKLKHYKEAVEAFTKAIDITPTLSLFDHRAAAYDRLEDYTAAVKDGREMIKSDKQDVKGYLRTASILEKMEKLDTALGIYQYGLKNVPASDKNFQLLQQHHDKITRKLSPPKSIDPLTVLPLELAEIVLGYLAFRHLVNCMRVSRGWRDYIAKLPRLWMHLDLSGARRTVPRKFIDKAVRHSENRLTRVTIHNFEHFDVLRNVAKACKCLTDMEFLSLPHSMSSGLVDVVQYATKLERFVVRSEISMNTMVQILETRPTLRHIKFDLDETQWVTTLLRGPFPLLESIAIRAEKSPDHRLLNALFDLLELTPNLKVLDFQDGYARVTSALVLTPLSLTTLILKAGTIFPTLPKTLQTFSIEYISSYNLHARDRTALLRSYLPSLTHLSLIDVNNLCADRLEELLDLYTDENGDLHTLQDATPLQSLTIRGILSSENAGLFNPATNSLFTRSPRILTPALRHLDLAKMACDDDDVEYLLTHNTTGLTSIDLSYTRISGASIKMLVDGLPCLKVIRADNCSRISGRDAIEYAGRKGVSVSCSMGEGKGGKKVRYG